MIFILNKIKIAEMSVIETLIILLLKNFILSGKYKDLNKF